VIDRLANVIYWLGIILAALLLAFAVEGVVTAPSGVDPFELAILQAGLAAFVYGFGWIIRYVLTGRRGLL
jgi:hypothetical protein